MKSRKPAILAVMFLALLAAGCDRDGVAVAAASAATSSTAPSRLGDLSPFRAIAADVDGMLTRGELPQAIARIKDLEVAWDEAEGGIKPRAAKDWHTVDKAIDTALAALRSDHADLADCRQKLAALLLTIDSMAETHQVSPS
jgi:hypothetical protein